MISVLSTNITSPLGFTTKQNYRAVLSGSSALKRHEGLWGLPEPFAASLFSEELRAALAIDGHTFFESIAIRSIREALTHTRLDVASERVVLIVSTTKGNVEWLDTPHYYPSEAAQAIAQAIGLTTKPIVVCNACVSGLSAQLLADRLLSEGIYDYAIVVGAEVQCKFIVSGFQSLKGKSLADHSTSSATASTPEKQQPPLSSRRPPTERVGNSWTEPPATMPTTTYHLPRKATD